jgi:hypothetical protein
MPVRDGAPFIRQALDSLVAQSFRDFEVVVVDDASTDGTRDVVAAIDDDRVRLLRNDWPLGPAASRNRAIDEARSARIAFLDADDVAEPDRLEQEVASLRRDPHVGLVAARVRLIDETGWPTGDCWGWADEASLLAPTMLFRNVLPTSTVMLKRRVLRDDRFDESLDVASDYDLWLRLIARAPAIVRSEALARYRRNPSGVTARRHGAAAACLERIARRAIERLGIEPSADELRTHARIAARRHDGSREPLEAVERWLTRLDAANGESGVYDPRAFRRVIVREWLAACDGAARQGAWNVADVVLASRLTRVAIADRQLRRGLGPLPWRTLRGLVRRRWPAVGRAHRAVQQWTPF